MALVDSYTAESIRVLTGIQAVRLRPGMYVGDVTRRDAMDRLLWEVTGNAIDEALAGHATSISIAFDGARVTVEDDGRSIPIEYLERVMTTLHAGTGWRRDHVHLTRSMHGVGVAVTCALSSELEVTAWRDGHEYVQRFARGEPVGPIARIGPTRRTGLRVSFVPDFTILTEHAWNIPAIAARCRPLAGVLPGLTLAVDRETWRHDSLVDYVEERAGRDVIDPFVIQTQANGIAIDLALAWTRGETTSFEALVNCNPCPAGVHVVALRAALHDVLAPRFAKLIRPTFDKRLARGMVGVLHVQLHDPRFGNPTKDWLGNPEVGTTVREVVAREFARHLEEVPALVDVLVLDLARPARVIRSRRHGRGSEAAAGTRLRRQRSA